MTDFGRVRRLAGRLLAEFAVIVVGILIALWADGRASDRRDRATELARISALALNVEQTGAALELEIARTVSGVDALRALVYVTTEELDEEEVLRSLVYGFLNIPGFSPELNVYDDLKNSGELGLLTDPELRQALSAMEAALDNITAVQQDVNVVQQLNLDPYLIRSVDLGPILGPYLEMNDLGGATEEGWDFVTGREFRNLVIFKLDLMVLAQEAMEDAARELRGVAALLAEHIGAAVE